MKNFKDYSDELTDEILGKKEITYILSKDKKRVHKVKKMKYESQDRVH